MKAYKVFVSHGSGYGDYYLVLANSEENAKKEIIALLGDYENYYFIQQLQPEDKNNTIFMIFST